MSNEFTITPIKGYEENGGNLVFVVPKSKHPIRGDIVIVEDIRYLVIGVYVQNNQSSGIPNITRPFTDTEVGLLVFKESEISVARPK